MFEDLLYQNVRQVGGSTSQDTVAPTGLSLGTGVRVVATEKQYTQGNMQTTGNSLDVAVNGRGFFQVLLPDGTMGYTRDGDFEVNPQGELVDFQRLSRAAGHHDSGRRADHHHRQGRRGHGEAGWPACADADRHAAAGGLHQSRGPAAQGENILVESAASGTPQVGTPGLNGLGLHRAGLAGSVQRQRRGRAGEHDRNPARLRDELKGDLDHGSDAVVSDRISFEVVLTAMISDSAMR